MNADARAKQRSYWRPWYHRQRAKGRCTVCGEPSTKAKCCLKSTANQLAVQDVAKCANFGWRKAKCTKPDRASCQE